MKKTYVLCLVLALLSCKTYAQSNELYDSYIRQADSLLNAGVYQAAAKSYTAAFESFGWKGFLDDRYHAAQAWAMSGVPDSAFFNLLRITERLNFDQYDQMMFEKNFVPIHTDVRWPDLCQKVKSNQPKFADLAMLLTTIHTEDQKYRLMIDSIEAKFGGGSTEILALWKVIQEKDSLNLIQVKAILDKYGWLGPKDIGDKGSSALFLVIQHSELATQEKYLPMMREAVKKGNARGSSLALLEDRVNMRNGRKQIYGSQLSRPNGADSYVLFPIEDAINVDKRRAEVGLGPLADYISNWGLTWDEAAAKKMDSEPFEGKK